jgi:GTP-binding protein HflX
MRETRWKVEENLEELDSLANTAGAEVVDRIIQDRKHLDPALFIGKGKAEELAEYIIIKDIDMIIFDDELSPAQVKNLENILKIKVIDRSGLILDIFAAHARTREARTQVELAQLNYYLPRLTRQWEHLSRQVGGIGTKGPGETQLETDRRLIRARIAHLKRDLEKIKNQNETQRKRSSDLTKIAIIGYTNTGKSTLMNALTNAETRVEDKLFATLDTTVRKLKLGRGVMALLSDTVGFIRKLPHDLVASFQTTLAQTIESDILIHVVDFSHRTFNEQMSVVDGVLEDFKINTKPTLLVMNKVDKVGNSDIIQRARLKYPKAIFISAQKKIRTEKIKEKLLDILKERFREKSITLEYNKSYILAQIRKLGNILESRYLAEEILIKIRIPRENEPKLNSLLADMNNLSSAINHIIDL